MKVYGAATSACTHKVLMVLAEKNHHADLIEVSVLKGQDKSAAHRERQPFGEIPVLDDDGFVLYESRAIIRYLDQRLPGPALTPRDLRSRGLMEQWISIEQSYVSGPVWELVRAGPIYEIIRQSPGAEFLPPPPDQAAIAAARYGLAKAFDVADATLAGQQYLAGPQFSLAEVTWLPYVQYLIASNGWDLIEDRPNLARWWREISSRGTWRRVGHVLERPE
ncbi:glutathione S-transferase N-terminal domain-containing protein [Nocardia cyriacigeorgica]|uniref:glutathione S-transferase family protein n=1 Tax=Nocardia cyriacigeorgica TaxID=135487 RepID=UPI0018962BCF|nr:glutathione S-transferase N-terminal domain-containing protein [Nocardia cyriacigeorgica]MBF6098722.1 glutathione S-transferase N-terminal domain-containing protein [Nocardia cyriacigeorgica]MBF6317473.1 glutathione S-transferase N-terminal domain-containing protein [Nocardia cyriacigeorgica]MBF6531975.1 glutathione S-transferase N-terminal domain-containing protein [Nocardia cyriacigeorgica]